MLKKILIASAIFSITTGIACADAAPYLGVNLGVQTGNWKYKNAAGNNTHFNATGVKGGIFGGYGGTVDENIYLGAEAFIDDSSDSTSKKFVDNVGSIVSLKTTYSYGASIIPGIKVGKNTMAYLRAGIIRTRFEVSQPATISGFTLQEWPSNNTATGGQLGIGVQTSLTKNVDVRAEYVYTAYSSFSSNSNSVSPTNNQIDAGLVYKFG